MKSAEVLHEITRPVCEVIDVATAMIEDKLSFFLPFKGKKEVFELLLVYIESLEEYRNRIVNLREKIYSIIEKDTESYVAVALGLKKEFADRPGFSQEVRVNIDQAGSYEKNSTQNIRLYFEQALAREDVALSKARELKDVFMSP